MIIPGSFQQNDSMNSPLLSTECSFSHYLSCNVQPTACPAGCDQPPHSLQSFRAVLVFTWQPELGSVALVLTDGLEQGQSHVCKGRFRAVRVQAWVRGRSDSAGSK